MNVLIVADSFKGSLSSAEVGQAIAEGFQKGSDPLACRVIPIADGGEGMVEALVSGCRGSLVYETVRGPLGKPVDAAFGVLPDGVAVIEMAQTSGLLLIPEEERNPLITSTYGTGELIRAALDKGFRRLVVGIGGSATNDGGAGMARALGARFLDRTGNELPEGGAALSGLARIDLDALDPRLKESDIVVACDVSNPLCGPLGASRVFGPQKGADENDVEILEAALRHYGAVLSGCVGFDVTEMAGAGAAGGLGAGLFAFCGARPKAGIEVVLELLKVRDYAREADLIVTGEGCIDETSLHGKLISGVGALAAELGKTAIAFSGAVKVELSALRQRGIACAIPICDGPLSLEYSCTHARQLLVSAAERSAALITVGRDAVQNADGGPGQKQNRE